MAANRDFDQLKHDELYLLRHGFFKASYEITDSVYCYGVIDYASRSGGYSTLKTTKDTLTIKRKGKFDGTLLIYNSKGEQIASISGRLIEFNNGFQGALFAKFSFRSFTLGYTCKNLQVGDIFSMKQSNRSYKKPFTINLNTALLKNNPEIPFTVLLGANIALMEQRRSY